MSTPHARGADPPLNLRPMNATRLLLLYMVSATLAACNFRIRPTTAVPATARCEIVRFDRLEARFVRTGDYAALGQMRTEHAAQTRLLIEDVLRLGDATDPDAARRLLDYYQDTTLLTVLDAIDTAYADLSAEEAALGRAFERLGRQLEGFTPPKVYAQVGALGESVIIGEGTVTISLDKYLGPDFPPYARFWPAKERATMRRSHIVPDCVLFLLAALYPVPDYKDLPQARRRTVAACLMWAANQVLDKPFFPQHETEGVARYMRRHRKCTLEELLTTEKLDLYGR